MYLIIQHPNSRYMSITHFPFGTPSDTLLEAAKKEAVKDHAMVIARILNTDTQRHSEYIVHKDGYVEHSVTKDIREAVDV